MTKTKKIIINSVLAIGCIIAFSAQAVAQPNITGVSGTLTNGSTITISGSVFGSKPSAPPISWDNFENQTVGSDINNSRPIIGPIWTTFKLDPATDPTIFTNTNSHSGSKSAFIQWIAETINSFGWGGQGPFDKIYVTFWRYLSSDTYSTNHKIMYLYGDSSCGGQSGQPNFTIGAVGAGLRDTWILSNNSPCTAVTEDYYNTGGYTWYNTLNTWQRWEVYLQLNDVGVANAVVKWWINAQSVLNVNNATLRYNSGRYTDLRIGHMFQVPISNSKTWIDDVYIDNTQARVEIGDSPSWNSNSHREIQIPSAWTDTSITVTVNQGSFSNLNNAYLYVIDANGNSNINGFPLCTSCPRPPVNLKVQ